MIKFTNGLFGLIAVFTITTAHATPGMQKLQGQVLLNGKLDNVTVETLARGFSIKENIVVGQEEFLIHSKNSSEISGSLEIIANRKVIVKKSVQIFFSGALTMAQSDPSGFATEMNLTNASEFTCPKSANALLLLGDDLNKPYPLIGNCLLLK